MTEEEVAAMLESDVTLPDGSTKKLGDCTREDLQLLAQSYEGARKRFCGRCQTTTPTTDRRNGRAGKFSTSPPDVGNHPRAGRSRAAESLSERRRT